MLDHSDRMEPTRSRELKPSQYFATGATCAEPLRTLLTSVAPWLRLAALAHFAH